MESSSSNSGKWVLWTAVGVVLLCLCVVVVVAIGAAAYFLINGSSNPIDAPLVEATVEPPVAVTRPPLESVSTVTAETLASVEIPENDPYELACRLQSICGVEKTLPAPTRPYSVGDTRKFWILNGDTIEHFQIDATLHYVTPHSYFWAENGVEVDDQQVAALMDAFENDIYPTDRRFFGTEWTPGVDNDPHIYVVFARNLGASTAGYYSPPDEINPKVRQYSNAAEMFVFSADGISLEDEYTFGTLAHEFQHMIHWYRDKNESSWVNEGFSELASFINGYSAGGADFVYAEQPDIPLEDWTSLSDQTDVTVGHYGQAFLFMTYFLDRFGDEATQALVQHEENGLTGIDHVLQDLAITDPKTGRPITTEDVVIDWMLAMYLGDPAVGDGRFVFSNYNDAPQTSATDTIRRCPSDPLSRSVSQYGPDYIEVSCSGDHTIEFLGSTATRLLPAEAHSGTFAFWSSSDDESDTKLTREFDLTGVAGPVELSYWTWYDLEAGWDYIYLEASTDGESWTILDTPSCSNADTSGNAYGCGYTDKSGGGGQAAWIKESVDLSRFAGQKVQLRFEYITDAAVNEEGMLLDDISIPAINYSEDFESGEGDWVGEGFARIENILPQTFKLALIHQAQDGTTVEYLDVNADQTASIPVSLGSGESAVLVITGTQRFTRLPAGYTVQVR